MMLFRAKRRFHYQADWRTVFGRLLEGLRGMSSMTRRARSTTTPIPLNRTYARSEVERRVLGMIESGTPYNIGDLAAELHLSPSHLQRLFKRETGTRMGEWLIELRLQKAAYLLAKSYLSVKEVARSAGYEHVSSFIRAFERRYVLTPTQYRERADSASSDSGGSAA
jgi:AraC-like DNA-binding protein